MNFCHPETNVAAALGLSAEVLRLQRAEVLTAGLDYDKRGKRLCYSQRGVLNLAAASGLDEPSALALLAKLDSAETTNLPAANPVPALPAAIRPESSEDSGPVWARVHRHFINVRQIAIILAKTGAIERCRVKHSGHFKLGDRIQVRLSPQKGDTFYVLDQRETTP